MYGVFQSGGPAHPAPSTSTPMHNTGPFDFDVEGVDRIF